MKTECKFCEVCGTPYENLVWPRKCHKCGNIRYLNPAGAAMAMVPVEDTLLYIRRAIEPGVGLWAMPGGYIDVNETAEEAASRELKEETGLVIPAKKFKVFGPTHKSTSGLHTLIFCIANIEPLTREELNQQLNIDPEEIMEVAPYNDEMQIAFQIHSLVLEYWYDRKAKLACMPR